MGRRIDEQRWESWRRRLDRYERWNGTVAAFCLREGVSPVAFYQWRRKLDDGPPERRSVRTDEQADTETPPRFLPIRLETAEPVTIDFPNGVSVRVPLAAGRTLDAVLAAAARCEVASNRSEAGAC